MVATVEAPSLRAAKLSFNERRELDGLPFERLVFVANPDEEVGSASSAALTPTSLP